MALLTIKDLSLGYDSCRIIENLNFTVDKGDYLSIVGENGSGKTTLMKTILKLQKPIAGEIIVSNDLKANEIGYLPQQTVIQRDFPASVKEIVLSGCLSRMGLRPFYGKKEKMIAEENMCKMGILDLKNRCYRELSGGQQQRVLLARTLCASRKLLLLEDESSISEFVEITLIKAGYAVLTADRGEDAIRMIDGDPSIDIAILDVMLPDISGFDVCKHIRSLGRRTGIIMLTARSQESDRITGLMLGADDYVVKPFSPSELVLRVDALYRRVNPSPDEPETVIALGEFELDERARILTRNGSPIELTQVEYQMVSTFFENAGKALSREDILHAVWGDGYKGDVKIVDVNVRRLRIKLEENPAVPTHLLTVWGYGYKWA